MIGQILAVGTLLVVVALLFRDMHRLATENEKLQARCQDVEAVVDELQTWATRMLYAVLIRLVEHDRVEEIDAILLELSQHVHPPPAVVASSVLFIVSPLRTRLEHYPYFLSTFRQRLLAAGEDADGLLAGFDAA